MEKEDRTLRNARLLEMMILLIHPKLLLPVLENPLTHHLGRRLENNILLQTEIEYVTLLCYFF
jgi:hypothetical protein